MLHVALNSMRYDRFFIFFYIIIPSPDFLSLYLRELQLKIFFYLTESKVAVELCSILTSDGVPLCFGKNSFPGHLGSREGGGGEASKNKLKDASFIFSTTKVTILSIFRTHAQKEYRIFFGNEGHLYP